MARRVGSVHYSELAPAQASALVPHADRLRPAVAAYLARFKGTSRDHTASDLRCYLAWYAERGLDPFLARRPHLELYIRWMQEVRRFKPPTVSRRFSVNNRRARPVYPKDGTLAIADGHTRQAARGSLERLRPIGGTAIGKWLLLAARELFQTREDSAPRRTWIEAKSSTPSST